MRYCELADPYFKHPCGDTYEKALVLCFFEILIHLLFQIL